MRRMRYWWRLLIWWWVRPTDCINDARVTLALIRRFPHDIAAREQFKQDYVDIWRKSRPVY